jgi:hypothetical protein
MGLSKGFILKSAGFHGIAFPELNPGLTRLCNSATITDIHKMDDEKIPAFIGDSIGKVSLRIGVVPAIPDVWNPCLKSIRLKYCS